MKSSPLNKEEEGKFANSRPIFVSSRYSHNGCDIYVTLEQLFCYWKDEIEPYDVTERFFRSNL